MSKHKTVEVDLEQLRLLCQVATLLAAGAATMTRKDLRQHADDLLEELGNFGAICRRGADRKPWTVHP